MNSPPTCDVITVPSASASSEVEPDVRYSIRGKQPKQIDALTPTVRLIESMDHRQPPPSRHGQASTSSLASHSADGVELSFPETALADCFHAPHVHNSHSGCWIILLRFRHHGPYDFHSILSLLTCPYPKFGRLTRRKDGQFLPSCVLHGSRNPSLLVTSLPQGYNPKHPIATANSISVPSRGWHKLECTPTMLAAFHLALRGLTASDERPCYIWEDTY